MTNKNVEQRADGWLEISVSESYILQDPLAVPISPHLRKGNIRYNLGPEAEVYLAQMQSGLI